MGGNESSLMADYDDSVASLGGSIIVQRWSLDYAYTALSTGKAWWSWMKLRTAGRCGRCGVSTDPQGTAVGIGNLHPVDRIEELSHTMVIALTLNFVVGW